MFYDALDFVRSCVPCQQYKTARKGPQGLMSKRVVETPRSVVSADIMEFLANTHGNKYLLVFQDLFTKWVELMPLRTANGNNIARAFEDLILFRWETPNVLLTDNGTEFDNKT